MNRKKKSILLMILLLLVAVTSCFVAGTYAKYTSQITGNEGEATVAKWAFVDDNETQEIEIALEGTVDPTTLVEERIAPGTSGSFDVELVNTNTEVGVDFSILINSITNKPTNLVFYRDANHTEELTPGTTTITGQLEAEDSTGLTVPIYWEWVYESDQPATDDPIDTQDGEAANTITVGITITGTQVAPGAAISTHVDD